MKLLRLIILCCLVVSCSLVGLAAKVKKSPTPEEVLEQAREAFFDYDFDRAAELYEQYKTLSTKAKAPMNPDIEVWETELEIAGNAFERVQKIVIIDSISLPRSNFYKSYRLSKSSGQLGKIDEIVTDLQSNNKNIGFLNETGDYIILPELSKDGGLVLYDHYKLLDGNWEKKETLVGDFEKTGDYVYPFMSADGQTLYFSNNGEDSMGGYDIFVAQRDAITGEYLQPLNLGMPFNSPYDDLLMAIDEETGLGWWATDRNSEDNKVTVYIYLVDELRKNYPIDTENLSDHAKITEYKSTWEPGKEKEYKRILSNLPEGGSSIEEKSKDFEFDLGNGKIYYYLKDFRNRKAAELMKQYLSLSSELTQKEVSMQKLRMQYNTNKSLSQEIIKGEKEIDTLRDRTITLKNQILSLEKSSR